jgi:broad specificity phosphatase PhoE
LPAKQAKELELKMNGVNDFTIVSSPLRRCLQTTKVVADTLGIKNISIHLGVFD